MKVVDTDREMYGTSKNAKTFVIISDGQVWSGNVQHALALAAQQRHHGGRHRRRHLDRRHDSAAARRQGRGAGRLRARSGRRWIASR